MKKNLAWIAGALMAVLAACGGSQKSDPNMPMPANNPNMAPSPAPGDPPASPPPANPCNPTPPK